METLTDVALAQYTTLRVGGPARELVEARDERALVEAVRDADARGMPVLVLGGGSNLLVSDAGFDGRVVRVATQGVARAVEGATARVTAAAGVVWDGLVAACVARGDAGVECLSGIPGLVGATPIQNVGAYGQDVSETVTRVRAWDRLAGDVVTLSRDDCGFAYRDSAFKRAGGARWVVLEVEFALRVGGAAGVRYAELSRALEGDASPGLGRVRDAVLALRRAKSMVLDEADPDTRSAGSFFTNPVVDVATADAVEARARAAGALAAGATMPRFAAGEGRVKLAAGWLIERAGVAKGLRMGGAAVSRAHALALVNREGATAAEVVALARHVRDAVRARWGVTLEPEPALVGFAGDPLG